MKKNKSDDTFAQNRNSILVIAFFVTGGLTFLCFSRQGYYTQTQSQVRAFTYISSSDNISGITEQKDSLNFLRLVNQSFQEDK